MLKTNIEEYQNFIRLDSIINLGIIFNIYYVEYIGTFFMVANANGNIAGELSITDMIFKPSKYLLYDVQ